MERKPHVAIIFAVCLFFLQVVPFLYARWVEDESWYSCVGYTLATEGRIRNPVFPDSDVESHVDTRPPAMPLTLAGTVKLLGPGPQQFRLPSVLAGAATVVFAFFLASELISPTAGVIAVILLATDNFLFMTARSVRPDVFVACFGVLGAWLFFRARRTQCFLLALSSAFAIGIAVNYHPNGIAVAISLGLCLLFEFRTRIFKAPRFWAFVLGIALSIAPFAFWVSSNPARTDAFKRLWGRGQSTTVEMLMSQEKARYSDFIGIQSQRIPLPINIPTRIHIVVSIIMAAILLLSTAPSVAGWITLLVVPSLLLWTTEVNPTSRFFVIVAPYLTVVLVAGALAFGKTPTRMRITICVLVLIGLTQAAGNTYLLGRARSADYRAVTFGLRELIPGDAPVYGAITFWLALYDRPFYAYNRTPLDYGLQHGVRYIIMNDRVMLNGTGYGSNFFEPLLLQLKAFLPKHGELVGTVKNAFYGDLEVYRINGSELASGQLR